MSAAFCFRMQVDPVAGPTLEPDIPAFNPNRTILRREIERQVETLIAVLDEMDGDPDLEPEGDDEPSLGWTKTMALGGSRDLEDARG